MRCKVITVNKTEKLENAINKWLETFGSPDKIRFINNYGTQWFQVAVIYYE